MTNDLGVHTCFEEVQEFFCGQGLRQDTDQASTDTGMGIECRHCNGIGGRLSSDFFQEGSECGHAWGVGAPPNRGHAVGAGCNLPGLGKAFGTQLLLQRFKESIFYGGVEGLPMGLWGQDTGVQQSQTCRDLCIYPLMVHIVEVRVDSVDREFIPDSQYYGSLGISGPGNFFQAFENSRVVCDYDIAAFVDSLLKDFFRCIEANEDPAYFGIGVPDDEACVVIIFLISRRGKLLQKAD